MTDTPQNRKQIRAPSGTLSTPAGAAPYEKGDIIWGIYKQSEWPAIVTGYYPNKPKNEQLFYVFLPLQKKSSVYKTDPSKVRPFTLEEELPEDATPDLEESFSQARRMLIGVSEEEIITEIKQKKAATSSSSTPTASAKKETTPKNTPKSQQKKTTMTTPEPGGSGPPGVPKVAAPDLEESPAGGNGPPPVPKMPRGAKAEQQKSAMDADDDGIRVWGTDGEDNQENASMSTAPNNGGKIVKGGKEYIVLDF